ncbi:Methionyl-tRNA formyltransferase [Knufia peltigerae]|uniref:methionyl-tRNA formyltransferase n=1 Tax=Knufia peltigerae TaxID=1002370 RepID=A0AA38YEN9_9EURO|nr:Methionyl-tRNA formyltransferase [Knufia peltigerae]
MKRTPFWPSSYWHTSSRTSRWSGLSSPRLLSTQKPKGDPLRVLFCGSDSFSATSLTALHAFSKTPQANIASIDVLTRTDKRSGRGLKHVNSPPIKHVAQRLDLPVHQIDTFRGWSSPEYQGLNGRINLVVAVSFGLLIPRRILDSAKYNGLNVHPSMLPDLPGAAPIQWSIIYGRTTTGITVQTLHPSKFDQGTILDQTPAPGIEIPNPQSITTPQLIDLLAPLGADMLVNVIRHRLYIPPQTPIRDQENPEEVAMAPKITAQMRVVDFAKFTGTELLRRNRAIGPLQVFIKNDDAMKDTIRIKISEDARFATASDIPEGLRSCADSIPVGVPYAIIPKSQDPIESDKPLLVNTLATDGEGRQLVFPHMTVASMGKSTGAAAAARTVVFLRAESVGDFCLQVSTRPFELPEIHTA